MGSLGSLCVSPSKVRTDSFARGVAPKDRGDTGWTGETETESAEGARVDVVCTTDDTENLERLEERRNPGDDKRTDLTIR